MTRCIPLFLGLLLAGNTVPALAERALREPETGAGLDISSFRGEAVKRIRFARLQGWEAIDQENLVLWISNREAFLLQLAGPCIDLDFKFQIALTSFGQTIDAGFDAILLNNQRCRIKKIFTVDLDRYRKAKAPYDANALQPSEAIELRQVDEAPRESDAGKQ